MNAAKEVAAATNSCRYCGIGRKHHVELAQLSLIAKSQTLINEAPPGIEAIESAQRGASIPDDWMLLVQKVLDGERSREMI